MLKVRNHVRKVLLKSFLAVTFMLCGSVAMAQNNVSGVITDDNGEPLIGVTVVEAVTQNATVTDIDGRYTLNVKPGAKLNLTYVGYENLTINAGQSAKMKEDQAVLNEVVVVGYVTMRR